MTLKNFTYRLILLILVISMLAPSVALAAKPAAPPAEKAPPDLFIDGMYDIGDAYIDQYIDLELAGTTLPFEQKELLSLLFKSTLRRDFKATPKEYIHQDLVLAILKDELKRRSPDKWTRKLDIMETYVTASKVALKMNLAFVQRQLLHLNPFVWQTPEQLAANLDVIAATNKELAVYNKVNQVRMPSNPWRNSLLNHHNFRLGSAFKQLVDIHQNGWNRALNFEKAPRELDAVELNPTEESQLGNRPSEEDLADNYSDVDDQLHNSVALSDQAMDKFQEDVEANGTNKLLQATAEENVHLTDRMNKAEADTIRANVKSISIGVMLGIAGTALGMAMQSSSAMRSFGSYGHSSPSSSFSSAPSHAIRAPSIGGSFDGAVGQSLYTRF